MSCMAVAVVVVVITSARLEGCVCEGDRLEG